MAPPRQTNINGIPAMFSVGRANTSSGAVDVSVMAYRWDQDTVYHFVMLTQGGAGIGPFTPMVDSLRRLTAQEAVGDPAAGDRCGDGAARRYGPVAGAAHGLSRLSSSSASCRSTAWPATRGSSPDRRSSGRLRIAADLTAARPRASTSYVLGDVADVAPHAAGTAAKRLEAAHHAQRRSGRQSGRIRSRLRRDRPHRGCANSYG